VVRQEERPASQVIDWDFHGQFSRLVGPPLLDEVRNPTIRLDGDVSHGIFPQVQGSLVPGIFWNTFRHRAWKGWIKSHGFGGTA
jgi:hypothetical protein